MQRRDGSERDATPKADEGHYQIRGDRVRPHSRDHRVLAILSVQHRLSSIGQRNTRLQIPRMASANAASVEGGYRTYRRPRQADPYEEVERYRCAAASSRPSPAG